MTAIFISYRSDDPGWSIVLDDRLSAVFGAQEVFRAGRWIALGDSFPDIVRTAVIGAAVVLVVVGPRWLAPLPEGRRIDRPQDWVRQEVRLALAARLPIVLVLVDGAPAPAAADLPEDIRALAGQQHLRVSHKRVDADIGLLVDYVRQFVACRPSRRRTLPPHLARVAAAEPAAQGAGEATSGAAADGGHARRCLCWPAERGSELTEPKRDYLRQAGHGSGPDIGA